MTPRALEVSPGEEVLFKLSGPVGTVQLFFPNPDLFGTQLVTLDAESDSVTLTASDDAVPAPYPYAVYSEEIKRFVRATPDPIIILD